MKKAIRLLLLVQFQQLERLRYTLNLVFGGTIKYTNKQVEAEPQVQRNSLSLA